jgi:hypothetical protein
LLFFSEDRHYEGFMRATAPSGSLEQIFDDFDHHSQRGVQMSIIVPMELLLDKRHGLQCTCPRFSILRIIRRRNCDESPPDGDEEV